jgi:hypothetical protein
MGITQRRDLVPQSFPSDGVVQLEFAANVPWVLSEPYAG